MERASLGMVLVACLGAGCGGDVHASGGRGPGDATGRVDGGRGRGDAGAIDGGGRADGGDDVSEGDEGVNDGDGGVAIPPPPRRDAGSAPASPADQALSEEVITKLIECTLLATGVQVPANADIRDETDRCTARCNLAAECDAIRAYACDGADPPGLASCLAGCPDAPPDGFDCGDGTRIAHALLCDGTTQCQDGADEADCMAPCKDGSGEGGLGITCDGTEDCADGSDEASCLLCEG